MPEYFRWMEENFELFFALSIGWILACAGFFAWRRHRVGPIHPPYSQSDVRFVEKYVSGSSDKNLFTQLGGARNALVVTVLRDGVLIEPLGVFKWLMPQGFNDLEHYVPKKDILRVEPATALGRKTVQLQVLGRDQRSRTLQLQFRKQEEFLAALES